MPWVGEMSLKNSFTSVLSGVPECLLVLTDPLQCFLGL